MYSYEPQSFNQNLNLFRRNLVLGGRSEPDLSVIFTAPYEVCTRRYIEREPQGSCELQLSDEGKNAYTDYLHFF